MTSCHEWTGDNKRSSRLQRQACTTCVVQRWRPAACGSIINSHQQGRSSRERTRSAGVARLSAVSRRDVRPLNSTKSLQGEDSCDPANLAGHQLNYSSPANSLSFLVDVIKTSWQRHVANATASLQPLVSLARCVRFFRPNPTTPTAL